MKKKADFALFAKRYVGFDSVIKPSKTIEEMYNELHKFLVLKALGSIKESKIGK